MSGKAWRSWSALVITRCCTTPGRVSVSSTLGAGGTARIAQAGRRAAGLDAAQPRRCRPCRWRLGRHRGLPVARVISGDPLGLPVGLLSAEVCETGRQWSWDGVNFQLWQWPMPKTATNAPACCRSRPMASDLLTGDIDTAAERVLLDSPLAVTPTALVAGPASWQPQFVFDGAAQGSEAQSGADFPWAGQFVRPSAPDGHGALSQAGLRIYDSAEQGAIHLQLGTFRPPLTMRQQRRFWRDAPEPH
jgi:competence protein ComEC